MKDLFYLIPLIVLFSCNSNGVEPKITSKQHLHEANAKMKSSEPIIAERIHGPANIRDKPNGAVIFELYDNVLVNVSKEEVQKDWYEVEVYADVKHSEFGLDSIPKDRPIINSNDTIGKVKLTHMVTTGKGQNFSYAILKGYTYKKNIKPETIIESQLENKLLGNRKEIRSWVNFIKSFDLDTNALKYKQFKTFYNYENTVDDPSPGYRVILLFENEQLIGIVHSRKLKIEKAKTHKLNPSYFVTFLEGYPEKEQLKFVMFMEDWIEKID